MFAPGAFPGQSYIPFMLSGPSLEESSACVGSELLQAVVARAFLAPEALLAVFAVPCRGVDHLQTDDPWLSE